MGKRCDSMVEIARVAAGLSQTDGNLASVSGTVLGKHMPRESSPPSALCRAARMNAPLTECSQIGSSMRGDSKHVKHVFRCCQGRGWQGFMLHALQVPGSCEGGLVRTKSWYILGYVQNVQSPIGNNECIQLSGS